jgi:HPt (histidine-containing phosphotransfer) domain-containing protein
MIETASALNAPSMPHCLHPATSRPSAPADVAAGGGGAGLACGLLDAQALARLQELDPQGQSGLVQRVLATYTQSLQRLLPQLRAARDKGDREALRHAAHTLKSSSASVGALALSASCAAVEAELRDGGPALSAHLDGLLDEGERILRGLSAR